MPSREFVFQCPVYCCCCVLLFINDLFMCIRWTGPGGVDALVLEYKNKAGRAVHDASQKLHDELETQRKTQRKQNTTQAAAAAVAATNAALAKHRLCRKAADAKAAAMAVARAANQHNKAQAVSDSATPAADVTCEASEGTAEDHRRCEADANEHAAAEAVADAATAAAFDLKFEATAAAALNTAEWKEVAEQMLAHLQKRRAEKAQAAAHEKAKVGAERVTACCGSKPYKPSTFGVARIRVCD